MADRTAIDVSSPTGGWGAPWPNVAEIEAALPHERWTLVGGLMAQLHAIHRGVDALRPTNDVDIVLHVETTRGVAAQAANALESIGYAFAPSIDERNPIAHRFVRGSSQVDLVTSAPNVVDVLVADHAAPRVIEKLRGKDMMSIEGGTQALRRTVNARLQITPGRTTTLSVPSAFGALVLKAAAYQTDSRDKERHLQDAAFLLSVIEDPYAEREQFAAQTRHVWRRSRGPCLTVHERGGHYPQIDRLTVKPPSVSSRRESRRTLARGQLRDQCCWDGTIAGP